MTASASTTPGPSGNVRFSNAPGIRLETRNVSRKPLVVPTATCGVGVPITSSESSAGLATGVAFTSKVRVTVPNAALARPAFVTGTLNSRPPATKNSERLPSAAAGVASSEDWSVMPFVCGTANCLTSRPSAVSKWAISIPAPWLWATKSWPVSTKPTLARAFGPKTSASSPTSAPPTGVPSLSRRKCTTPSAVP